MRPQLVLALICTALCLPAPTLPQQAPARFGSFRQTQLVRIRTVHHGLHVGRFVAMTADSIFLRPQRGSDTIETAAISELWVRGTATRQGAVIGAATVGVVGAAMLSLLSVAMCDAAECAVDGRATVVGLIGGAVAGAISGAVLGAMAGRWHRRYP